jgi:hypothetical protein
MLLESFVLGYRTKLALLLGISLLAGLLLHSLAVILLNWINSGLSLLNRRFQSLEWLRQIPRSQGELLDRAHLAMEQTVGEQLKIGNDATGAIRILANYYTAMYPDLREPLQSESILTDITAALVPSLFSAMLVAAQPLRPWILGAFLLALIVAFAQLKRFYGMMAQLITVAYFWKKGGVKN